jgi:hypothetical protein
MSTLWWVLVIDTHRHRLQIPLRTLLCLGMGEGVANHIGPEPCVVGREAGDEASAGVRIGQPLSRERINWDADAVVTAEGKTGMRVNASA